MKLLRWNIKLTPSDKRQITINDRDKGVGKQDPGGNVIEIEMILITKIEISMTLKEQN